MCGETKQYTIVYSQCCLKGGDHDHYSRWRFREQTDFLKHGTSITMANPHRSKSGGLDLMIQKE